ncbi:MAG: hypothetical protein ACTSVV_01435 [Promethearchaeota archaeon]
MVDSHDYSFFGQKTAMMVRTFSKNDPNVFFKFIGKKPNGEWEKPSKGEGKIIKFSLEEIVSILQVLKRKLKNWTTYHTFKENGTQIIFSWANNEFKDLRIKVDNYSKIINRPQVEILRLLLEHILKEKIIYSTTSNKEQSYDTAESIKDNLNFVPEYAEPIIQEVIPTSDKYYEREKIKTDYNAMNKENRIITKVQSSNAKNDKTEISGLIKIETEKAIYMEIPNQGGIWVPKSTIHSNYTNDSNKFQRILIDNWFLKKKGIIS